MEGEIMSDSSTHGITSVADEKGAPAPAKDAGQPLPAAVPPAATTGGEPTGDGGEGDLAPSPSTGETPSLAEMLGKKVEQPPVTKSEQPSGQITPDAMELILKERDHWKSQAEAKQERQGFKQVIDKVVSGLDESVYDRDEVRSQLELTAPVVKAVAEEMIAPLHQKIQALEKDLDHNRQLRRQAAMERGRVELEGWVKEQGELTSSGIEMFWGKQLDEMVGAYAADFGLKPDSVMDSDEGYKRFVSMINNDLLAFKARQAKAATARRETAEARTVPGGRSPRPNGGLTEDMLVGKPFAEQQKIVMEYRRNKKLGS